MKFESGFARGQVRLTDVIVANDHGTVTGGQAKVAIESALQLKARGLNVCFIAGSGAVDERLLDAGIACHSVQPHDLLSNPSRASAAISGLWNSAAARTLSACIATRDAASTIVHVHGWAKALSPSIGPVVTKADVAHVYTLHEYFLACPNGGFYDYAAGKICTRRPMSVACVTARCDSRAMHHKMWRVARHAGLQHASKMPSELREFIYLSRKQREIMAPHFSPHARWHYLPNAAGSQPPNRTRAEDNDLFLFIGRLSPEKGGVIVAEAAKRAGVKIAFCGAGEEEQAIRRSNPEAVMLGWLSEAELKEWIQRARCLLFPSLWYECHPLVVVDAIRAGLPVLVSQTTLAASIIEDSGAGETIPTGDVGAWSEAMRKLRSPTKVAQLSRAAFAAGRQLLGPEEYADRLIGIYQTVLARRHAPARAQR